LDWSDWVIPGTPWVSVPWADWASIPNTQTLGVFTGTANGEVNRFFVASTDNGVIIPYSVSTKLYQTDPRYNINIDHIELYLQQAGLPEALSVIFYGYLQPLASTANAVVAVAVELADETTFFMRILPGPLAPANTASNFIQLVMSSAGVAAQFKFGGATIWLDQHLRGDYGFSQ